MRPYITVKFAETLDGKIAARDDSSRWISAPEGLKLTHRLRARNDAVLVGIETVLKDNPSLTTRLVKGKNAARVVVDRRLRVPLNSKIVKEAKNVRTILVAAKKASREKSEELRKKGVETLFFPSRKGYIELEKIVGALYKKGIKKLLVEGGKKTITYFLKAGLVDRLVVIVAPKILGKGLEAVGDLGIRSIKAALKLRLASVRRLGPDVLIVAK